uniref:uncharacterized protein LOC120347974 n=1 Tax=Styela clava TaxID=7725 RepID=UPI00193A85B9|nr:uncharacterized protein LOC120347974 [Styela clava]
MDAFTKDLCGYAILDSGCTRTVCGKIWLLDYLQRIKESEIEKIHTGDSGGVFMFGDGRKVSSLYSIQIPGYIGDTKVNISCDVVDENIPLLLSKDSMRRSNTVIDFAENRVEMFYKPVRTLENKKYYCVSFFPDNNKSPTPRIFITAKERKLNKLSSNMLKKVIDNCQVRKIYKKPSPKPGVGLIRATDFNEVIAIDLHQLGPNLCIYGPPRQVFTDNGGEFNNAVFCDMAENFNIELKTSAAESPWSNGLVERHNSILTEILLEIRESESLDWKTAFSWSLNAKNSLHNVHGYSPYHLSVRRALQKQIRSHGDEIYETGDTVYYKRENSEKWRVPAKVIGADGCVVFLRHGGLGIRAHKCRLMHDKQREVKVEQNEEQISSNEARPKTDQGNESSEYNDGLSASPVVKRDPQRGQIVEFKEDVTGNKKVAKVLGRAGKATGKYSTKTFIDLDTVENVMDDLPAQEIPIVDQTDNGPKPKARLVVRGFEKDCLSELKTDSPTCSKESLRLVLALLAQKNWSPKTMDIKTAFLQGKSLERDIFIKPPDQKILKRNVVWPLKKCVYGLTDASMYWYESVKETLLKLGARISVVDPALFYYFDHDLKGVIALHVDDFLWGGSEEFERKFIKSLREQFKSGSELLIEADVLKVRSLLGQILWVSNQTRPDVSFASSTLTSALKNCSVKTVIEVNKIVRQLKAQKVTLKFPAIHDNEVRFLVYSDASCGNLSDGGTQVGHIVFMIGGNGKIPLCWQSKRIKRVVKSTLSAETLSMSDGVDTAVLLAALYSELTTGRVQPEKFGIECCTDSQSLCDAIKSTKAVSEKRLTIDIYGLKEMVSSHRISCIKKLPSDQQLADCLTKKGASSNELLNALC